MKCKYKVKNFFNADTNDFSGGIKKPGSVGNGLFYFSGYNYFTFCHPLLLQNQHL